MSSENNAPPCKYYVGQVLGKVDIVVVDTDYDCDEWHIGISTDTDFDVEHTTYPEEFLEEIISELNPTKKLDKLRLQAVALNEQITKLQEELGL